MTPKKPPEQKKPRRRRWPGVLTVIGACLLVAGGSWIILQATIAGIVQDTLLAYAARNGIHDLTLKVRQITPWHADIQTLRSDGSTSDDRLQLDNLSLDYSPSSLKAHEIEVIRISGLYLHIEKTAQGWILAGLPPELLRPAAAPDTGAPPRSRPDWGVTRLEIRNSRLKIRQADLDLTVPFEFKAHAAGETKDHYRGHLVCHPGGQTFRTAFELNLAQQQLTLEGRAETLDLRQLSQALVPESDLAFKGRLAAAYQARLAMNPPALETAAIEIRLPGTIDLAPSRTLQAIDPENPLVTVTFDTDRTWALHAPGMAITTPYRLRVMDWKGRLMPATVGWRWDGQFHLALPPWTAAAGAGTPSDNRMPITYRGEWKPDGQWSMALDGESNRWVVGMNPARRPAGEPGRFHFTPRLSVRASGQKHHVQIEGAAHLSDFKGTHPDGAVRIPAVVLQATGEGPWRQFKGHYDLQADNLNLRMRRVKAHVPRLAMTGAFATENQSLRLSGQTRLSRAALHLPDQQIHLKGLRLKIPFSWPYASSTAGGTFTLAAATWKEIALGAVRGQIRQRANGADVRIAHESQVLPGGQLQVNGRLNLESGNGPPRMDFDYRFTRPASPEDLDLGPLMTELTGIQFNGRIDAEGRGTYRAGHMTAGLKLNLAGARLLLPEQKGGVVGLKGAIVFPDLLAMRTAPRQQFFFERAYIGDIAATDGQFDFQIEPGGVFFLEQSRFKWCRGSVHLPATRIVPGDHDYEFTLWCDRLQLAPLLEQLGAARAEGGGTVSGRIPVRFRQGQVLVDSGFLYSSPGEGGTIRLRGTEMLTAGVPPGTPEYTQLELARQALKEYDYRWVKLSLATAPKDDLLLLKLQLDGKPTRPLPFIYDPQAGGFVPAGPDSKGSHFQGISLDVNFSLPLNRLLEYKDLLKLFS